MATHVVTALQLNLRSTPDPTKNNKITVLAQGTKVTRIADASLAGWWEISVTLAGLPLRGYVNSGYLGPLGTSFPSGTVTAGKLPAADLGSKSSATRSYAGAWAFSIGESGKPGKASAHPSGPVKGILKIIDWLDVADGGHKRWKPNVYTYCNIYVYDVCSIAGCYIPRVWWTSKAIDDLKAGKTVEAKYADTVNEMAANYLFNWLVEHGEAFGWSRVFDPDALQSAANGGSIAIICAQRTELNRPGHIQIVAPEHGDHAAKRVGGKVTQPLQSQAGASNFSYGFLGSNWWQGAAFRDFGFWINTPA